MGIGNLGISEILIITVIVLVFFGPARLPEIARSVGGALRDFRRSLNDLQRELEESGSGAASSGEDSGRPRHRPGPAAGEPILPSGGRGATDREQDPESWPADGADRPPVRPESEPTQGEAEVEPEEEAEEEEGTGSAGEREG